MRWDLQGTEEQNWIIEGALMLCDFPWEELNRDTIPVEWADLSIYGAAQTAEHALAMRAGTIEEHDHSGAYDPMVREVDGRMRVLGLAWYNGKVSIDLSLESDPLLAQEVFLSEAAHMTDFFYMDDPLRVAVYNAAHPDDHDLPLDTNIEDATDLGHGHGWFDVGGYYTWLGEWYMGAFVLGFSHQFPVTIEFEHPLTQDAAEEVRHAFMLKFLEDHPVVPTDPTPPTDPPQGCLPKFLARVNRFIQSWISPEP
jgi:hypothetical protein